MSLRGARLRVGGAVFSGKAIGWLYRSQGYPLPRKHERIESNTLDAITPTQKEFSMEEFNYKASAELFPSRRYAKTQQTRYRRFATAAEAIRYVVEELPSSGMAGSFLEVDENRFEGETIRTLYDAAAYPLSRQKAAA